MVQWNSWVDCMFYIASTGSEFKNQRSKNILSLGNSLFFYDSLFFNVKRPILWWLTEYRGDSAMIVQTQFVCFAICYWTSWNGHPKQLSERSDSSPSISCLMFITKNLFIFRYLFCSWFINWPPENKEYKAYF